MATRRSASSSAGSSLRADLARPASRLRATRLARLAALVLLAGAAGGCIDPEPPVLFVPLAHADPKADPVVIVAETLSELGYVVRPPRRGSRAVITDWVY